MKNAVLILGATSGIGSAAAAAFARRGYPLCLAARDDEELQRTAQDVRIRYRVPVHTALFDAVAYDTHASLLQQIARDTGPLSGVLLAFGLLGAEEMACDEFSEVEALLACNLVGACSLLTHCASYFEQRDSGFIAAISSVAGDRGRRGNYAYGAAKGGLSIFLQGMRSRLHAKGIQVTTIKPGFVDTAMTYGRSGIFLVASPRFVGERIVRAVERGKDIVYVPWFWRPVMWIVRSLPERLFKRLNI